MEIELDDRGGEVGPNQYEDAEGYIMPLPPATGPRRIPRGEFPTGPPVGDRLPPIVGVDQHGNTVDLEVDRAGAPAALVVFRSAVW